MISSNNNQSIYQIAIPFTTGTTCTYSNPAMVIYETKPVSSSNFIIVNNNGLLHSSLQSQRYNAQSNINQYLTMQQTMIHSNMNMNSNMYLPLTSTNTASLVHVQSRDRNTNTLNNNIIANIIQPLPSIPTRPIPSTPTTSTTPINININGTTAISLSPSSPRNSDISQQTGTIYAQSNDAHSLLGHSTTYNNTEGNKSHNNNNTNNNHSANNKNEPTKIDSIQMHGFDCHICGKRLSRKYNLKQHLRLHTNERPFKCQFLGCNASFNQKHSLQNHTRTHTGEKPYKCDECNKSFAVRHNLVTHKRLHSGERPYQCSLCDKKFVSKSAVNSHLKHKHKRK